MQEETKQNLDEMLNVLLYQADQAQELIETLDPGSQERSRLVSDVLKLMEHVENVYNREYDSNLKYEEIRRKYLIEGAKTTATLITAGTGAVGLWVWFKSFKQGLEFEQTGSITTATVRGVAGMMTKLFGFFKF